ncbi:inorganic diphosphatase [Candidatus Parcubacteria bacterium]|nr:inorganic diphosphatase [Candidatus Parcubacteria bacterium]
MTNLFKDIPAGDNSPEEINVVVDIPKGCANKYEYDEEKECFKLDRVNYSPMFYPCDYGFIPQTHSEDGDALDVLLLTTYPTFSGCVVKARPIGMILMKDEAGNDDKIVAVPVEKVDPRFKEIQDIDDVPEHLRKEIKIYLEDYKKLEPEKYEHVKVGKFQGKEKALEIIKKAIEAYKTNNK